MKIALTGATGFIGNYIARHLIQQGHQLNCWYRESSDRSRLQTIEDSINWQPGNLDDFDSADRLVQGCDAVVHNAFWRPGSGFRGAEGNVVEFARVNLLGTLGLIESSLSAGAGRFVFVSTCAVHEQILTDRPLDEAHPLWPLSHYGAHKAAIEKFVHSYGSGSGFPISAVRPTGVYGIRHPVTSSKWFGLISRIVNNQTVRVKGGGKEVHAGDVAVAIGILLQSDGIAGQAYSCYDRYISEYDVATVAKEICGSRSQIIGEPRTPANQIVTEKIRSLGMEFGGESLFRKTVSELIEIIREGQHVVGLQQT